MAVDVIPTQIDANNNNETYAKTSAIESINNLKNRSLTPYERLTKELTDDERCAKDVSLGRRIGFYRLRGDLGSGNFAKVKLGYHCLVKEKVAAKILDKGKLDQKTQRLLSREIISMERLHHPNIIRIFEVLETYSRIYMIVEFASGGELFHKIVNDGKFSEHMSKVYFAQIISAVSHMHNHNIIHRDIKAENVFLTASGMAKLGDLGFSTLLKSADQHLTTFCGSPPYAAPELFKDDYYLGRYVDIWALGVLLYFMVTGTMPYRADTVGKLKRKILEGTYTIPEHVSAPCNFLITQILRPLPCDRFTIPEIMRSLWLEGVQYPEELNSHRLKPPLPNEEGLSLEDEEACQQLTDYGITEEMIAACPSDTCRNNINGTYRLSVYQNEKRILQKQRDKEKLMERELEKLKLEENQKSQSMKKSNPQSKFCNIL